MVLYNTYQSEGYEIILKDTEFCWLGYGCQLNIECGCWTNAHQHSIIMYAISVVI